MKFKELEGAQYILVRPHNHWLVQLQCPTTNVVIFVNQNVINVRRQISADFSAKSHLVCVNLVVLRKLCEKLHCFPGEFTHLEQILQDRWSWRLQQILTLILTNWVGSLSDQWKMIWFWFWNILFRHSDWNGLDKGQALSIWTPLHILCSNWL